MSPTARSLAWFRKMGIPVAIVEKWNVHAKIRIDLFGMFDLLALCDGHMLGVQVTSSSHSADRVKKITDSPHFPAWLAAGGRAAVHGWSKKGARGKRKLWELTAVTVEPLPPPSLPDSEAA